MRTIELGRTHLGFNRIVVGVVLLMIGVLGMGCYPKSAPAPKALTAETAASVSSRWPGVTASSLAAGHELFLARCNDCHGYPDLPTYSETAWPHIIEKMGKKSHLNKEQQDDVLHYILAARSIPTDP